MKKHIMLDKKKAIAYILILLVTFIPVTSIVNAEETEDLNRVTDEVIKYIKISEEGKPEYNREEAINNNVDDEVLGIADKTYEFMMSQYNDASDIQPMATAFPIYGNWCGPNYGSGTPIDLLDTGCKNHDNCYKKRGRHKCSCDKEFLQYINSRYSKMTGVKQKSMAKVMVAWLKIKTSSQNNTGGNFSCKK